MTEPYCRKHGHWDCPRCGNKEHPGELIARLTLKLSEAREFIESVEKCLGCNACAVRAGEILKEWKDRK